MSTLYIAKITLLKWKSRIHSFLFLNIVGHTQLLCSTDAAHEPLNCEAKCSSSRDIAQVSPQVSLHMICFLTGTPCGLHFACREKIALYPHLGFLTKERYCFFNPSSFKLYKVLICLIHVHCNENNPCTNFHCVKVSCTWEKRPHYLIFTGINFRWCKKDASEFM